ncbi:hypothetical protein OAE61_00575 [Verrucomicrobiales bacterium]|jgi:hypothetical protein|nr:hypothetical protein [bacterium]MDB4662107.1 hypothetical protein [Verrucomicrobiales bacterium]MDC0321777.1 hypothetical protein [Verrucomicrobiales bacterium]
MGDIFDVVGDDGNIIHIEVAPLNGGQTFKTIMEEIWEDTKQPKLKPHVKPERD